MRAYCVTRLLPSIVIGIAMVVANGSMSFGDPPKAAVADAAKTIKPLEKAFSAGLARTDSERRSNNAAAMDCTRFFEAFGRFRNLEDYKAFFASKGIDAVSVMQNHQHFFYVTLSQKYLFLSGYRSFRMGDELRLVFTTASPQSTAITSFTAKLLQPNLL
jgi:hypothetical protein